MRDRPPDLGERKGPPRRQPRQGPIRSNQLTKRTQKGQPRQLPAYVPGRGSKSHQAIAKQLRDDDVLPIRVRVFALQAAHRLSIAARITRESERELRRLHAQRRRQLGAFEKLYR